MLLKGESEQISKGRKSPCCSDGDIHTEQMKKEFDELQSPPKGLVDGLVETNDDKIREDFLSNTMAYNNSFAFASVHHGDPCPDDQLGGRKDTCKYNGKYCSCSGQ